MQECFESGRVEAATMAKASANDVVVVRRNCLEDVQQCDGIFEFLLGPPHQAGRITRIVMRQVFSGSLQLPRSSLHQQLGALMDDLKRQLIRMRHFLYWFLQ